MDTQKVVEDGLAAWERLSATPPDDPTVRDLFQVVVLIGNVVGALIHRPAEETTNGPA